MTHHDAHPVGDDVPTGADQWADLASLHLQVSLLLHRYCLHFDLNEPERIAALFTDDAVLDYGPEFPAIRGRANIEPSVSVGLRERFAATSHHLSNVICERTGSQSATASAYVYAWHQYVDGSPEGELWGQYHCTFRQEAGAWLIASLQLRAAGMRDFHRNTMHPVGRRQV
jgi:hypothetical protein